MPALLEISGRRRIFFKLLEVAVFDLLHERFAAEKIGLEILEKPAGHDEKLVVDNFGKGNGTARRNEMRAPLENQAGIPQSGEGKNGNGSGECGAAGAKELRGAIEKDRKAKNEKRSERNEKAVAIGRDAGPIGVTGNEKVKSEKTGEQRCANGWYAAAEEEKTGDGEKKNGRPGKQAVIGREKHREEVRRRPVPLSKGNIAGLKKASVDEIARDGGGEQADKHDHGEKNVAREELRDGRDFCSPGVMGVSAKGGEILARRFHDENGEQHGVGVVDVEHEAGDQTENQPLAERARGTRLVPIPKEEGHGKGRMCVGPRRIEIHIDGQRAGPPDGERGEERPALFHVLARETEGQKQT